MWLWTHSLQLLFGSWNADRTEVQTLRRDLEFIPLGAGMQIKQKCKHGAAILDSLTADPLWELEYC